MAIKRFRTNGGQRVAPSMTHETILVVDDNTALRRSVERLLSLEGFSVLLADSGLTALTILSEGDDLPDLILSDIAMPDMDGFELFEAVRNEPAWIDIPFVFLTARDEEETLRRGYELGADDYLVKPFNQERLLLVVRSKLKRRRDLKAYLESQRAAIEVAQQELSVMVAHELRTPLTSISMVSDILSREVHAMESDQVQNMLSIMQTGSIRLNRLIEQMVMYVELRSGALQTAIAEQSYAVSVTHLIAGAIKEVQALDYQHHRPQFVIEGDLEGVTVRGDRHSLRHAFVEILMNAVMYSPPDSPITITGHAHPYEVEITIEDSGTGIAPSDHERVFEAFHQIGREKLEQQGIGIGLTLARGITEAHGGMIGLDSVPGVGTQVGVHLPLYGGGQL